MNKVVSLSLTIFLLSIAALNAMQTMREDSVTFYQPDEKGTTLCWSYLGRSVPMAF